MKIKLIVVIMLMLGITALFSAYSGDDADYPGGSPAGYTGSPADGQDCHNCHGGSASNVTGWITSTIPTQGYTAGTTYTITVTVSGSGNKGFEVSPQNASGTLLGTLTAGSGNHIVGTKYVTQNAKGTANPTVWSFDWTAPAAGTGTVTFYGAFVVSKPVTKLCTLVVGEYAPLGVTASATPSTICISQSSQLNAAPSGGTGSYTYSWTSVPAGFTSTIANPVVAPVQTTKYFVTVADGATTVNDSIQVTVHQNATAFAGNDTTCNLNVSQIQLHGTAANYSSVAWTTSGDGTFNNTGILNAIYYPGANDKITRAFDLTLMANAASPCTSNATDGVHILLDPYAQVGDAANGAPFIVYPNPAHETLHISFPEGTGSVADVTLYDNTSRVVVHNGDAATSGCRIDVSGLTKGIYLLRVKTEKSTGMQKVVVN